MRFLFQLKRFKPNSLARAYSTTAPSCPGDVPIIHPVRCESVLIHQNYTASLRDYSEGAIIMDRIVRQFLDQKKNSTDSRPPPPTLLTFQFNPVYTLGRREKGSLSSAEVTKALSDNGRAQVFETFRGGQTTFHGPGQLVAYPIIDLRAFDSSSSNGLTKNSIPVRCYVSMLERTIINLLQNTYKLDTAQTTTNTGVWVDDDHKIAALGIHVRRHITSHGIALNVNTDTAWFDRIVACGLPDKKTTTIEQWTHTQAPPVSSVADEFAAELATNLHLDLKTAYVD